METPIIINYNQNSKKNIIIDISQEYIKFNKEGVFISLEMIGELDIDGNVKKTKNPRPGFTYTNKTTNDFKVSKLFYKTKFDNEWKSFSHLKFHLEKEIFFGNSISLS